MELCNVEKHLWICDVLLCFDAEEQLKRRSGNNRPSAGCSITERWDEQCQAITTGDTKSTNNSNVPFRHQYWRQDRAQKEQRELSGGDTETTTKAKKELRPGGSWGKGGYQWKWKALMELTPHFKPKHIISAAFIISLLWSFSFLSHAAECHLTMCVWVGVWVIISSKTSHNR